MSGEDAWDPGPVCWSFRYRCPACGKQIQVIDGQRVKPACGHEDEAVRVEMECEGEAGT